MAPNASAVYKIRATATGSPLDATNTAVVAAAESDPSPANNTDSASTLVNNVDLSVTKTVNDTTPNAGDTVIFTVTVHNSSPSSFPTRRSSDLDTYTSGLTNAKVCLVNG